jgi:hypothetical protein
MITDEERALDLLVAELEYENKLIRARNERLEKELTEALDEAARFKTAMARVLAVSKLAFRDGEPEGVGEVGTQAPPGAGTGTVLV